MPLLEAEMQQVFEILPSRRQGPTYIAWRATVADILATQGQDISCHGTGVFCPEYFDFSSMDPSYWYGVIQTQYE